MKAASSGLSRRLVLFVIPLVWIALLSPPAHAQPAPLPLAGEWRFQLDRADAGIGEQWFERTLPEKFKLPGSLPAAGIGDAPSLDTKWTGGVQAPKWFEEPRYAPYAKPDNFKFPFWLQPEKYYAGVAWFQRDIEIPKDWDGKRVVLFLERVHWESRVWVDGRCVGTNNSLSTPHEYELGIVGPASRRPPGQDKQDGDGRDARPTLAPGKHTVSIRLDNRRIVDIGENSHAITGHTQGNWNGIVGKIELRTTPLVWIEELQVYPNLLNNSIRVKGKLGNATGQIVTNGLAFNLLLYFGEPGRPHDRDVSVICASRSTDFVTEITRGLPPMPWDEFEQHYTTLLAATFSPVNRDITSHHMTGLSFGFREITSNEKQFTINGRKTFLRGTLDCCIFPKTGHPPMEEEEWKRIIGVAKSYGLNLIRFHSWCPPEAAFQAADALGLYFQIETCWANGGAANIGDGRPVDQWIYDETDRILKYYGNHPSFLLMLYGNEPGGRNANAFLAKYVEHFKAKDPRRLWSSGSGWPQLPENQFHVTPDPRIQAWGGGLKSRINARPPETTTDYRDYIAARKVPVISHEIGQWCVYPNFDEIPKYTGCLKPRNFEIFRDLLNEHGMGGLAKQFLLASGKLQTLCYKEDIESALRTPGMGGFELLDLHDFPGQGTALVGVLDPFWEEKGYVTAGEYSRFCNSTVPLVRLKKRVFTTDETLEAEIEVAHFGGGPISEAMAGWKLVSADGEIVMGEIFAHGTNVPFSEYLRVQPPLWYFPPNGTNIPAGGGCSVGRVAYPLRSLQVPGRYKLVAAVGSRLSVFGNDFTAGATTRTTGSGDPLRPWKKVIENDWDIWVYPAQPKTEPAKDILVTAQFDDAAQQRLASGGKLLLTLPGKAVRNFNTEPVKVGFSSIFWNTAWTGRQAPTTLGILCDPKHPALAEFPTEFHSNWQWWYLIHRAGALRLDLLPKGTEPIVRVIDDWFTARPLGLIVEGKVGQGKVIVCGFDLTRDADDPVSKQMRASLLAYMDSPKFAPKTDFTSDQIKSLITDGKQGKLRGVRSLKADSEQEGYEAANAIDGDPATMWHTTWGDLAAGFPHELVIEFDAPKSLIGFTALPRQDGNRNGWIKDFAIFTSADGQSWGEPAAKGAVPRNAELKTIKLAAPVTAKFIKLVALSGHAPGAFASLGEFGVIEAAH